ncbi:MAG: tRNA 2-thiocytidine(32) synthetase TtcA, partial [Clostridia bacterium]|nr:tRNA 2-thiocytidine(32) synthetase TtcA [Clostridia bacterium]
VTLLRPFIYIEEKNIKAYVNKAGLPIVKNTCPADGNTKREYVKNLLRQLDKEHPGARQRLFTAMCNSAEGWEPPKKHPRRKNDEN